MATWTLRDELELQNDDGTSSKIHVQEYTSGRFRAVFDGPTGLETTVEFDEVVQEGPTLEFYRTVGQRRIRTGCLESGAAGLEDFFEGV